MKINQRVKLFVDAHVFDGRFQGTRTFIKGIYTILLQKPDLLLYLGAYDIENLKENFPDARNIVFIKYRSTSGIVRLTYDIPSIIRKYKIQYAHFQYIVPLIKNCKFIVTTHDVIFNEYPDEFSLFYRITKNFLFRISALRADVLTTVSEYSKGSIQKYLGIKASAVHVTPNGVANRFFEKYDKQQSKNFILKNYGFEKFVLYVSRIEPRKNHAFLVKAYLQLKLYQRGYHLVLLGHETIAVPEFDKMMAELSSHIKSFIYINSETNDAGLLQFYRAATVFVYPSKAEGFGIPPLEAAALKIPVLCSNTSAMSDFTFFAGNHIDPFNYELFKEKLEQAVNAPPDDAYLKSVSDVVQHNYSWEQSANKLYEIIMR